MPRLLLVLDDDRERLSGFDGIAAQLGVAIKAWRTAPAMLAELDQYLPDAQLISLDHDLYKDAPEDADPGSGRQVADRLTIRKPVCPVIVHSTNTDAAWGMHNALRRSGWTVELVHHLNQPGWIKERWLPAARRLAFASPQPPIKAAWLTLAQYRALTRELATPTPQQVRQFAEYVAGAHSWYKHLPLLPAKVPIQVFLDPAAGMQVSLAADGTAGVAVRHEQGFHYSWLRTAEHLERFGHLAFSKSSGTTVALVAGDRTAQVASDDAPHVYDPARGDSMRCPRRC